MGKKYTVVKKDGYYIVENEGGQRLGVHDKESILEVDGFAFKDLNKNGVLDVYEDWRLPLETRVSDLASKMEVEEIAGLMLYSSHQAISLRNFLMEMMYPGQDYKDGREHPWELTDEQMSFLKEDNVRHVLVAMADSGHAAAKWNNEAQAFVERIGLGIPVNISSDPRHTAQATAEYDMGAGGDISKWPEHIGLAATFSPELVKEFGEIAAKEYRAMGITTALSPQVDLATEPRWNRFMGTFGESPKLSTAMSQAYCEGFQTSTGEKAIKDGWGYDSVNAMVKHWPGGGTGEGGRDAHFGYGRYAVYPGNNFNEHLKPFLEGAFNLNGGTKKASAVMPYYTISNDIDTKNHENVGNGYNKYLITDLLRDKYNYDDVVCTDWGITQEVGPKDTFFGGKAWGVEDLSIAERHYKILMAGVDQFGGNNEVKPVLEAYEMGAQEHGKDFMRKRFEKSATRLLKNIFRTGMFENPYIDAEETKKIVGNTDFVKKGLEAQVKSVVMLKNKNNILPIKEKTKVYVQKRYAYNTVDFFGRTTEVKAEYPINIDEVKKYYNVVETPEEAEVAFVFTEAPKNLPYSEKEGYLPITLQYRSYTATKAREKSLGEDDATYKGKTVKAINETVLDMVLDTKKAMGDKPVVVFANTDRPFVISEYEEAADAILMNFSVVPKALMEIASGKTEPSALLPFQMPKDMEAVETQDEDVPFDMEVYEDSEGNKYDYAYGLNYSGVIKDERTEKFSK